MDDKRLSEHIEKYKTMSEDQIKEYVRKSPMGKYDRLKFAYVRVDMLLDFMRVIRNHKSELQSPGIKVIVESGKEIDPADLLNEYIILEITSFYSLLRKIKEKERLDELPNMPEYWDIIINFRNQITAHLDKYGRIKDNSEWMEQCENVDKIGMTKIVEQFKKDYFKCIELLK